MRTILIWTGLLALNRLSLRSGTAPATGRLEAPRRPGRRAITPYFFCFAYLFRKTRSNSRAILIWTGLRASGSERLRAAKATRATRAVLVISIGKQGTDTNDSHLDGRPCPSIGYFLSSALPPLSPAPPPVLPVSWLCTRRVRPTARSSASNRRY